MALSDTTSAGSGVHVPPQAPSTAPCTRIVCPTWRSTLLWVVLDPERGPGLELRCKSDRGGTHFLSQKELERMWAALAEGKQKAVEKAGL